jgi:hypothetical protein
MQEYLPVADLTALYDNEPQFEETLFLEEKVDEKLVCHLHTHADPGFNT